VRYGLFFMAPPSGWLIAYEAWNVWEAPKRRCCYFWTDARDLERNVARVRLLVKATGTIYMANYWISPASAGCDPTHADYSAFDTPSAKGIWVHPRRGLFAWPIPTTGRLSCPVYSGYKRIA